MSRVRDHLRSINVVQIFLDLLIVFVGVYLAFVFANVQAERIEARERDRVIGLLKLGIERYERLFDGFVLSHNTYNQSFREAMDAGEIPYFGDTYYPAPSIPSMSSISS